MADEFAIIHTVADTSGGTQDFTDSGITDWKAALIIVSGSTSNSTTTEAHGRMSVGFVDSNGGTGCVGRRSQNGNTSFADTFTYGGFATSGAGRCAIIGAGSGVGGARSAELGFSAALSNGFRGTWATTPDQAYRMTILLIGGVSNTDIHVNTPGSTEALGFEPDFLIAATSTGSYSSTGSANNDYNASISFACNGDSLTQAAKQTEWTRLADPTDTIGRIDTISFGIEIDGGGTTGVYAVSSFSATGYSTGSASAGTPSAVVLAVKLSSATAMVACAGETIAASTGVQSFTGLGIRPMFVVGGASHQGVFATANGTRAGTESLFMFDGTTEYCAASHQEDALNVGAGSPTVAGSINDNRALTILDHQGTLIHRATLSQLTSTGFDLNFATASDTATMIVFAVAAMDLDQEVNETVEIGEDVVLVSPKENVIDETVQISEGVVTELGMGVMDPLDDPFRGTTMQGRGERGLSEEGGGVAGTTF